MSLESQTNVRPRVKVKVSSDAMSVSIVLRRPDETEAEISVEEIQDALAEKRVVFGINQTAIDEAVARKTYVTPVQVAQGIQPERGDPANLTYHFETDLHRSPSEGEDGRIDYRDVSVIQNTHQGDLLVTKTPPTRGKPGRNVHGKEIQGPHGRDLHIKRGSNTELSEDGLQLTAVANGTIVFVRGIVAVNDVTVIDGDVDFNVGNIDCAGSVRVKGDIKSGFTVRVDGNLEVGGNVEDANAYVNGDVLIKGGFFGDGDGRIEAENNITIKYSEGQTLVAGGDVVVGGEIIRCKVMAGGSVEVKGRRGKIVGGEVRALKKIQAGIVGSDAGTKTVVQVGFDEELYNEYQDTLAEIERLETDKERIKEALIMLHRLQLDTELTEIQKEVLDRLTQLKDDIPAGLEELERRSQRVQDELRRLQDAVIIVDTKIYHGVRACFGIVYRDIVQEAGPCKVTLEADRVMLSAHLD